MVVVDWGREGVVVVGGKGGSAGRGIVICLPASGDLCFTSSVLFLPISFCRGAAALVTSRPERERESVGWGVVWGGGEGERGGGRERGGGGG